MTIIVTTILSNAVITKETITSNAVIYDPRVPKVPNSSMRRTDHRHSTDGRGHFGIY